LIVGLGNPGREHAGTRHNVGFMVAEALTERWDLGRAKERFRGRIAQGRIPGAVSGAPGEQKRPSVAVLSPQTYMNDAGRSVGPARGDYHVGARDCQRLGAFDSQSGRSTGDQPDAPAQEKRALVSLLFADAVGFSKLAEEQIPQFVTHFLGPIAAR